MKWTLHGDMNTSFFHGRVQSRRMKNQVGSLFHDQGVEKFEETAKGDIAVAYFSNLF